MVNLTTFINYEVPYRFMIMIFDLALACSKRRGQGHAHFDWHYLYILLPERTLLFA